MDAQDGLRQRVDRWRASIRRARHEWRSFLTRRNGILLVAITVISIVATGLPMLPQTTEPTGPGPAASPRATEPPAEAWGELAVPAWEPIAELRPVDVDASGVAAQSAFTLRSRTSEPAATLATRLTAEPEVAFEIQPGGTPLEVTVVPAEPLVEGVLYRFRLADPTGALAGTWAYRTAHPLHVVSTLPGDRTTSVPVNTGIEIEFDQDGVTDISRQFSIKPAVNGRFEVHGRTVVFVPGKALAAATIYQVTVAAGVSMAGSDQVLDSATSFAFETAAGAGGPNWDIAFGRPILEASPEEAPIVAVNIAEPETGTPMSSIPLEVYRLPSVTAARQAAITLSLDQGWGQYAATDLVPTSDLARVAAFDGMFESSARSGSKVVRFPAALAAGWYLLVVPRDGRDRQALLQVTTLSAFALTSETRTIAWVNDTATGAPIVGANLTDPAGASIGSTAANGLLDVPTPASLLGAEDADAYWGTTTNVTVAAPDGRQLLVALGQQARSGAYDFERNLSSHASAPERRWWLLISTDRTTYRSTDTIHTWGVIRSRGDGSTPANLELGLRLPSSSPVDGPWLARVPLTATPRGTWAGDLPVNRLPLGSYVVELRAGGTVAAEAWVSVAEIRKPAYRIDVETDAHAYIAGDTVTISGRAVFFDGTSAAGLDLRVEAFNDSRTLTADAEGRIQLAIVAQNSQNYVDSPSIRVSPSAPEEGEISGYEGVHVFPSAAWITASGTVSGGQVLVNGSLNQVDLDRVERQVIESGWWQDPSGAAIAGRTVTVTVVESVPITRQVGTTYDYIEKTVIPLFEYTYQEHLVGTFTPTSGNDGQFALSVPVAHEENYYSVTLTALDGAGRRATTFTSATAADRRTGTDGPVRPYLAGGPSCGGYEGQEEHDVGDAIDLTMHDADGSVSTGGHYLFVDASHGIRSALVQDTSTFSRTYTEADLPSFHVLAVRFRDGTYIVTDEVLISTRLDSRALQVEITADRSRYAPGERATLAFRTTGPDGQPIAADVVVRAVDEKLYEIGAAFDVDALSWLLAPLGDGLLQSYASHPLPIRDGGGDCGGGGGDGREDFRDSALFELISTGSNGRASVSFDLPDDLTSWHVSATAVGSGVYAGSGALLVPVGLPFVADATFASDYLVGERPVLRLRSFGDDLTSGDRVQFTITAPSLLMPATTVEAVAFASATVELPELPAGVHEVTIAANVAGDTSRRDTLVRRIVVRASRLEVGTTELTTPAEAGSVGGPGLTTYVITDTGRGSLLPLLEGLAYGSGARFDRQFAADLARRLLVETFGVDEVSLPPTGFELARYQRGGVALLPYSSTELALTSVSAIVAPERLDGDAARAALQEWLAETTVTRERQIIALAGLAGLGEDRLAELHAIDIDAVTAREALWVALGLVASGDEDGARIIERGLLEAHGQALGPWIRLDVGGSLVDTLDASSLLALVAAGIGDPIAPSVARYVREMRTKEGLYVLPEIGFIRWSLDRLPRAAVSFAWTVDGARHVESLAPGASWSIALTEHQRSGLRLEPLAGSLSVIASWTRTPTAADLPSGDLVTIARTVTPAANAPTTGLVKVRLQVAFAAKAPTGCWDVSDRTPSGLAPLSNTAAWAAEGGPTTGILWPYEVAGKRVSWCIGPANGRREFTLGYSARVVSAGTFTWEPAVIQSVAAPDVGATTPVTSFTIR